MSGARTIETLDDPLRNFIRVRLCDGDQVLATREFSRRDLMLDAPARRAWDEAREYMRFHDLELEAGNELNAANAFLEAVRVLFPEFGTVPDGVETT